MKLLLTWRNCYHLQYSWMLKYFCMSTLHTLQIFILDITNMLYKYILRLQYTNAHQHTQYESIPIDIHGEYFSQYTYIGADLSCKTHEKQYLSAYRIPLILYIGNQYNRDIFRFEQTISKYVYYAVVRFCSSAFPKFPKLFGKTITRRAITTNSARNRL